MSRPSRKKPRIEPFIGIHKQWFKTLFAMIIIANTHRHIKDAISFHINCVFLYVCPISHKHRISFNSTILLLLLSSFFFESIKRISCSKEVPTSSIFIFNWVKLNTLRKYTINLSSSSNFNFLCSVSFSFFRYFVWFYWSFLFAVRGKRFRIGQAGVLWHFRFIKQIWCEPFFPLADIQLAHDIHKFYNCLMPQHKMKFCDCKLWVISNKSNGIRGFSPMKYSYELYYIANSNGVEYLEWIYHSLNRKLIVYCF